MANQLRTALITGASRGIGLAIAERCARAGLGVALVARDRARLDAAGSALAAGRTLTIAEDLRDPAAAARVVARCTQELGLPDLLVSNAGTAPSDKLENTTEEQLAEALDLHVRTPFRLLKQLVPGWRSRGSGCAVMVASTAGLRGYAFTSAYTAAKHGLVGLTRALAEEWRGTGLRIGALCPGFVDTEITRAAAERAAARGKVSAAEALARLGALNRIGRLHTPAEIAEAAWRFFEDPHFGASGSIWDLDADPQRLA
jgi:NAD(P)-dependent dehydrogenase (short-subunit alcohol dehydrogenase family)